MKKNQLWKFSPTLIAVLVLVAISPSFFPTESEGISNPVSFGGYFTITHADSEGNIISQQKDLPNLITNEAMECISDLIFPGGTDCVSEAVFQWVGVGTTNTAPVDGDTTLNAESGGCARVQDATVAVNTGTTGERTYTLTVVFSGGSCESEAYVEAGVFDASSSGNMLATLVFTAITLASGDTLTIDYDIKIENV